MVRLTKISVLARVNLSSKFKARVVKTFEPIINGRTYRHLPSWRDLQGE